MNIIKLDKEYYYKWNQFCYENNWFWHTTFWIEYLLNSKFIDFKDHSFFIAQDNKIVSVVPLIQENNELFSTGFDDKKEIIQEIKRIALENNIKRIQVNSDIKEYLNISEYTCILDLDNIKPTKGHKSAIKKGEKYLTCERFTDINKFKEDYFRIAGKVTRPDKTFKLLGDWISLGFGTLLVAKCNGDIAGYTYILHWKDCAYYFMSCTEEKYHEYNVSHFLQAKVFEVLLSKGVRYYELGSQVYNSLISQPSEKECNISKFKRGFGGNIVVNSVSEYFFDKDYCNEVMNERVKNYIENEY